MVKEWVLERDGEVVEALPAGFFKVKLDDVETIVRCKKSWKMSKAHISLLPGDFVKVEVNQYDMNQWRIVFRYNQSKSDAPYVRNKPQ